MTEHLDAIAALKTALAQPTAAPVAWLTEAVWGTDVALEKPDFCKAVFKTEPKVTALYAASQPAHEWQNLTEAELRYIRKRNQSHDTFAREIEARLQEKNT
jgi:hypothetical protein